MKFTFTIRKGDFTQEQKEYVEKKLAKLDKYFNGDTDVSVTFGEIRELKTLEVTVKQGSLVYRAEAREKDSNTSIDKIIDVLERQIRKHKTKLEKRLRENAFVDFSPFESDENVDYDITRTKNINVTPLSVEEAILQMELIGHTFFLFKNADEKDRFAVVYQRSDGGYGLINT